MMRLWTAEGGGGTVGAATEAAARRKLERERGYAVGRIYLDVEAEEWAELPDCPCGWSGTGTGRGGAFVRGDRCPACGSSLD